MEDTQTPYSALSRTAAGATGQDGRDETRPGSWRKVLQG
jgi:hypothetical protein